MNAHQIKAVQRITNRIHAHYGTMPDELMSYKLNQYDTFVQLSVSNVGSPWYCRGKLVIANIGPRGGVTWHSVEGMSANLILKH